jgi:hypothetical protein
MHTFPSLLLDLLPDPFVQRGNVNHFRFGTLSLNPLIAWPPRWQCERVVILEQDVIVAGRNGTLESRLPCGKQPIGKPELRKWQELHPDRRDHSVFLSHDGLVCFARRLHSGVFGILHLDDCTYQHAIVKQVVPICIAVSCFGLVLILVKVYSNSLGSACPLLGVRVGFV